MDTHLRKELVQRLCTLAERYSPNNAWYLATMNEVFLLGGELLSQDTGNNLMRFVAEGTGEDERADEDFRRYAVNTYVKLLNKTAAGSVLRGVVWNVGWRESAHFFPASLA